MARLAGCLIKLRDQINAQWPTRSKDSDGWIGDVAHSARKSDHNPDEFGVVHAVDITHDPGHGLDSYKLANLLLRKQDPRVSYIISNGRIGSGPAGVEPGVWRKYTGANKHDHHMHVSCLAGAHQDDSRPWDISGVTLVADPQFKPPPPTIQPGASNETVATLQKFLGVKVTGKYEPLSETEWALRLWQVRHGLDPDGIVGPMTWGVIAKLPKTA